MWGELMKRKGQHPDRVLTAVKVKALRQQSIASGASTSLMQRLYDRIAAARAIQYAWDNGLITDEEYAGAIPEPKKPKRIDFWTDEDEGTEETTDKKGDFESDKLKYFADLDEQLADLE